MKKRGRRSTKMQSMNSQASIQTDKDTLFVEGVVNFHSVVSLVAQGDRWLRSEAPAECRLDLSRVTRCNSAATTLLLSWMRTAHRCDKELTICHTPAALRSLLDLGGLEELLPTE